VWNKQEDVDEESEQRDQQSREGEYKQGEEVARRVGGRVEVSSDGETEAYQRHEGCDRVHDENGGKRMALGRG
jgi:hypothetical protein